MSLTYDDKVKIQIEAGLGHPAPATESAEASEYRAVAEAEARKAKENGVMLDLPCDWDATSRGVLANTFDPAQPRDESGKWSTAGVTPGHIKLQKSTVLKETEKAVQVHVLTDEGTDKIWLPKSHASVNEKGEVHASPWIIRQKEDEIAERNRYDIEHGASHILTGDPRTPEEEAAYQAQRQRTAFR